MSILNFLQKNWFLLLLLIVFIYISFDSQSKLNKYKEQIKGYQDQIKELNIKTQKQIKIIDSLKKLDTVIVEKIKYIKEKTDEQIKYVDTMSVSDMQDFFSDRYPIKKEE